MLICNFISTLSEIADLLEQQSDMKLGVVGHTDATGAVDYNMDLSTRRNKTYRLSQYYILQV